VLSPTNRRILLIDPAIEARDALAARLQMLGFEVSCASDGAEGAHIALGMPPAAVVADLFMPSISGAQLCRLLNAEPATADVPVILRGPEGRRHRFWAERTGAVAYVIKGRMGDLVRALSRFVNRNPTDGFFTTLAGDGGDVRDRIAAYLDAALFDSVIAAEVRNLAVCESFDRLFDLFAQFASQVTSYRWLAVVTDHPVRGGIHSRPGQRELAHREACLALDLSPKAELMIVEDEDAIEDASGPSAIVRPIMFGGTRLGAIAMGPRTGSESVDEKLVEVLARELGGALRTATLVEESQRLATIDSLTGLHNRRSFTDSALREVARAERHFDPLSFILLDVDHFKLINDRYGHATGDRVLQSIGRLLIATRRRSDLCARWGGEEFVMLLPNTAEDGGLLVAERTRAAIAALVVTDEAGSAIPVTASLGVASLGSQDSLDRFIDRADRAMYAAKTSGRNRVCVAEGPHENAGLKVVAQ